MAGGKRLNPRLESLLVFAVVIAAAALSAFIRSRATGQPFALNWGATIVAALASAAAFYLGPALLFHFGGGKRRGGK